MKQVAYALACMVLVLIATMFSQSFPRVAGGAAQGPTAIGVDADPSGNNATSLSPIQGCVSVSSGQTFHVDIFISDVVDLLGWEAYFVYDPSIVRVVGRDVQMFQAANAGSDVFDTSEPLPEHNGRYRISAVDIAEPPAPDSGSGVLARLTLEAVSPGISPASLPLLDVTGDDKPDLGPTLVDVAGNPIGDADGDRFFDGPIFDASIAVDTPCPPPSPTPAASPSPAPSADALPDGGAAGLMSEGARPIWAVACLGGGVVALLASALVLLPIVRRQYWASKQRPNY